MNLANMLTLSRCFLAVFIVLFLLQNSLMGNIVATVLFIAAVITDYFDGYVARTQGLISDFGKIMDPIADKVLMLMIFFVLSYLGMIAWWMTVVIFIREIAVTVSRLIASRRGLVIAAEQSGKIKTAMQMTVVILILFYLIAEQSQGFAGVFMNIESVWRVVIQILMFIVVFLTLSSGFSYFKNQWNSLKS